MTATRVKAWIKGHLVEIGTFLVGVVVVVLYLRTRGSQNGQPLASISYPAQSGGGSGGGSAGTDGAAQAPAPDDATAQALASLRADLTAAQKNAANQEAIRKRSDQVISSLIHKEYLDSQAAEATKKSLLDQIAALTGAQAESHNQDLQTQQHLAQEIADLQARLAAALAGIGTPPTNPAPSPTPPPATAGTGPATVPAPVPAPVPNPIAGSIFDFRPNRVYSVPVPRPVTVEGPDIGVWNQIAQGQLPGQNIVQQIQDAAYGTVRATPGLGSQHPQ